MTSGKKNKGKKTSPRRFRTGKRAAVTVCRSRRTFYIIGGSIAAAAVFAAFICFFALRSPQKKVPAVIAVPAEGGYIEAWTPLLPKIAKASGSSSVSIVVWTSAAALEELLAAAQEINLLWAEIPLDYSAVELPRLAARKLIDTVPSAPDKGSFSAALLASAGNYALPISYDPWICIGRKDSTPQTFPFFAEKGKVSLAVPGEEAASALAVFALSSGLTAQNEKPGSRSAALALLSEFSNDGRFQKNAYTYTERDALNLFLDGKAVQCYMPLSSFNRLGIEERLDFELAPPLPFITASITAAIFPARNTDRKKACAAFLRNPEIQFSAANSRFYIPAHTGFYSRSIYTRAVSALSEKTAFFIIPGTFYNSPPERAELIAAVKRALSSTQK